MQPKIVANIATTVVTGILKRPDVAVDNGAAIDVARSVAEGIQSNPTIAIVPVKNGLGKIEWTQIVGGLFVIASVFGFDIPPEVQVKILEVGTGAIVVVTYVLKRWFSNTVTPQSASKT